MTTTSLDLRDKKFHDFCCSGVKLQAVANGFRHERKKSNLRQWTGLVQFSYIAAVQDLFNFGDSGWKQALLRQKI